MLRSSRGIKIAVITFFSVVFSCFFGISDVQATTVSPDSIQKLAIMRGVYNCYRNYAKPEILLSDFTSTTSIFDTSVKAGDDWNEEDKSSATLLPTNVGNSDKNSRISCKDTITAFGSYYSFPHTLQGLGYVFSHNIGGERDDKSGTAEADVDQVTIKVESVANKNDPNAAKMSIEGAFTVSGTQSLKNHAMVSDKWKWGITSASGYLIVRYGSEVVYGTDIGNCLISMVATVPDGLESVKNSDHGSICYGLQIRETADRQSLEQAMSGFVSDIRNGIIAVAVDYYEEPDVTISIVNSMPNAGDTNNERAVYKPIGGSNATAAGTMFANVQLSGVPTGTGYYGNATQISPFWNADYTYSLYYEYLKNMVNKYPHVSINACVDTKPTDGYGYYFRGKPDNWCHIDIAADIKEAVLSEPMNVVGSVDLHEGTFEDVLDWLNDENSYQYVREDSYSDVTESNLDTISPNPEQGQEIPIQTDTLHEECYEHAHSLGWVLCPAIFGLQEMAEGLYEATEPLIRTNDSTVAQLGDNGSALYRAWATFRNMANIIFVIFFMFIIFSQLTGYGIDNYGIKRMLPKLIVTAILVNLSYVISAVVVDLSNIIGIAIKDLLMQVGSSISTSFEGHQGLAGAASYIVEHLINFFLYTGTAALIGTLAIGLMGWGVVIPILVFLIGFVGAILFALVALGIRQALVVAIIVLSPIAIACNILPNTEGIFKKWWGAAKAMIALFPIIAGAIGIGYLTSGIMLSVDNGFLMTLASGALLVAPYFLIPSFTTKALNSIDTMGTKLAGIGNRLTHGAQHRVNTSEAARNVRENAFNGRLGRWLDSRTIDAAKNGGWLRRHTIGSNSALRRVKQHEEQRVSGSRQTALQGAEAARLYRERMENQGYEARAANLESKAFEDAVADQMALWDKDGTFMNDTAFENEVENAAKRGDEIKLEALMRTAAKGSDNQRKRLISGASKAFAGGSVNKAIAGRLGSHLTNNGIYKTNDPSAYALGTALSNAVGNNTYGTKGKDGNGKDFDHTIGKFTMQNFAGSRIFNGKVAPTASFNFDDAEFDNLRDNIQYMSDSQKQQLVDFMQKAVDAKKNDTTGQYNGVKPETMQQIQRIITEASSSPTDMALYV